MSVLDRFRNRSPRGEARDSTAPGPGSTHEDRLPISGYDRLDEKEIVGRLRELSQVELAQVERYERSNRARPSVLNKLRFLRTVEPVPGYDTLAPEQVTEALGEADTETVKAVRNYERKFQRRPGVLAESDRVRPTSTPSAREDRVREESAERIREGIAGRAETADRLAGQ